MTTAREAWKASNDDFDIPFDVWEYVWNASRTALLAEIRETEGNDHCTNCGEPCGTAF